MKLKPASLAVLAWTALATACAPANDTTYWKHLDNGNPPLNQREADALLKKDIEGCKRATDYNPAVDNFNGCMLGDGWMRQRPTSYVTEWLKAGENTNPQVDVVAPTSAQQAAAQQSMTVTHTPQLSPLWQETNAQSNEQKAATEIPAPVQLTAPQQEKQQQTQVIAHDIRQDELVPQGGKFTVGVQGYQDRYSEHGLGVNAHTNYYGGEAGYTFRDGEHNFWTIEGRGAGGKESYNSPSGLLDNVPEYEAELRGLIGRDYPVGSSWISPYTGLGVRAFRQEGDGHETNLGKFAYDRRINQLYLPLGGTWRTLLFDRLTWANTIEGDALLIGQVNSRASNGGGLNITNTQRPFSGFGLRAESLVGVPVGNNLIEVGPFVRYWSVEDSTSDVLACGGGLCLFAEEPYNKRLQIGLTTRISF